MIIEIWCLAFQVRRQLRTHQGHIRTLADNQGYTASLRVSSILLALTEILSVF